MTSFQEKLARAPLAVMVGLCAAIAYLPSLGFDLLSWDDNITVLYNQAIRDLSGAGIWKIFTTPMGGYRYMPLTTLSWAADYAVAGLAPGQYHLTNLILHAINAMLVFDVLAQLMVLRGFASSRARVPAFCMALLWALHPMRVEVVSWVTGRTHSLAALFGLASCALFIRHLRGEPGPGRRYWPSVAAFVLSLLAFPSAISLPLVLAMLHAISRPPFGRRALRAIAPFAILAAGAAILALYTRAKIQSGSLAVPPMELKATNLLRVPLFFVHYLWKPWFPTNLSPVYTSLIGLRGLDVATTAAAAIFLALSVGSVVIWRSRPWLAAVWLCQVVLLIPIAGWAEPILMPSDRYSYLASLPALACLAMFFARLESRHAWGAGLALALTFATFTPPQELYWRDDVTLFEYVGSRLGDHPYRTDINWRLAAAYFNRGERERAVPIFRDVLAHTPKNSPSLVYLGIYHHDRSEWAAAAGNLRRALELEPQHENLRPLLVRAEAELARARPAPGSPASSPRE